MLAGKKGEWGQFKIPAIPWFRLNFLLFYCPGGRTHGSFAAKGFSPSAPPPIFPRSGNSLIWLANNVRETNLFSSFGFIWIKKGDTEDFRLQQTATKFGANIISATVYLFVGSP